jgi:ABC-2 type transport system ATP-binding protein
MILDLSYHVEKEIEDAVFGFGIFRNDGLWCYGTNTRIDRIENFSINKDGKYRVVLDGVNLVPGQYWIDVTIEFGEGNPVDYYKQAIEFEMVSNIGDVGVARIPHKWEL